MRNHAFHRTLLRTVALAIVLLATWVLPAQAGTAPTTTTLASTANPAAFGQFVIYTARVTATQAPAPTGTVTFLDGTTEILTVNLESDGSAAIGTNLSSGTHPLTARYNGDTVHAGSTSPVLNQVVGRAVSTTTLQSSLNPSREGQPVTFTARVAGTHFQAPVPTGSVTFLDGTTTLGSAPLDASGRASLTTPALVVGTRSVTARYAGDAAIEPSTSTVLQQVVEAALITIEVAVSTEPPPACGGTSSLDVVAGTPVTYCFTVTNHTAQTLRHHTLSSDQAWTSAPPTGDPFFGSMFELEVAPGASARHHVVVTSGANALPRFTWTASANPPTYAMDAEAPFAYADITAVATPVIGAAHVPLPFAFTLYGRTFEPQVDALCIYNNGAVQMVRHVDACGGAFPLYGGDNFMPPPPDALDSLLPFWDYLGEAGTVGYAVVGEAPLRSIVVEWRHKRHGYEEMLEMPCAADAGADCGVSFQLAIDEGTGVVRFSYDDVLFDTDGGDMLAIDRGGSATVALIDTSRALRQVVSNEQAVLDAPKTIAWTPSRRYIARADADVRVGAPRIAATPGILQATARPGEVLIRTLGIANTGSFPLEWSLDRAASNAHVPLAPRRVEPVGDPARSTLGEPQPAQVTEPWTSWSLPFAQPSAVHAVPAYGVRSEPLQFTMFTSLDASRGGRLVPVGTLYETYGGDFAHDDFTREYVLTECVSVAAECLSVVDTATGVVTDIAPAEAPPAAGGGFQRWTGMAWDRVGMEMFASSSTCEGTGRRSFLHRIKLDSGTVEAGPEIVTGGDVCIVDIAISPAGLLYGLDIVHDALVAIDKTTGAAQPIGSIGFDANYKQSMDFDDATGTLYLAGYRDTPSTLIAMYTLDTTTGAATLVNRLDYRYDFMTFAALAIARPGGVCTQPGDVPWLFYDLQHGTTAPGATSNARVVFDATSMGEGVHEATLCVASNDRATPLLGVPVRLEVGSPADRIFAGGFDAVP